jgi:hypothetical protein
MNMLRVDPKKMQRVEAALERLDALLPLPLGGGGDTVAAKQQVQAIFLDPARNP